MKKSEVTALTLGDKIWYWYKGLNLGSIEGEFIEYIPAKNKNQYDLVKIKTTESRLNPDKDGYLLVRLSHVYSDDPEYVASSSKKGFLNKGVHGTRKWS